MVAVGIEKIREQCNKVNRKLQPLVGFYEKDRTGSNLLRGKKRDGIEDEL